MKSIYKLLNKATRLAFIYKLLLVFSLAMLSSCTKDVLDKTPLSSFSDDAVWKDQNLIQTWINSTYRKMPQGYTWGAMMMANVTDESHYRTGRPDYIVRGNITSTTLGVLDYWTKGGEMSSAYSYWSVITNCNIFFDKIDASPVEAS